MSTLAPRTKRIANMQKNHSFKFLNTRLNQKLIGLLRRAEVEHVIDEDDFVHFSSDDEEVVEGLICSIRYKVFPSWQILNCASDWKDRYTSYMGRHDVPFSEELIDGELWFLIPRRYRPHAWKLSK